MPSDPIGYDLLLELCIGILKTGSSIVQQAILPILFERLKAKDPEELLSFLFTQKEDKRIDCLISLVLSQKITSMRTAAFLDFYRQSADTIGRCKILEHELVRHFPEMSMKDLICFCEEEGQYVALQLLAIQELKKRKQRQAEE